MEDQAPRSERLAVIDLGTNTFHLLIAEPDEQDGFRELYRERQFVKLAEAGIERIGPVQYERGQATLRHFAQELARWQVAQVRAIGTAALRTADNGELFVRQAEREAGIRIQLIPGAEEARLITQGVLLAVPATADRTLIMDIGGGSVEFIIADESGVYWAESFPVGVAVLYKYFHHTEPIAEDEIRQVRDFLHTQLAPLRQKLAEFPTDHLVGAAGTFDVIAELTGIEPRLPHSTRIDLSRFADLYYRLLATNREERHALPEVPHERADMIVVALILIDYVLEVMQPRLATVSFYSMKEGIMSEMLAEVRS